MTDPSKPDRAAVLGHMQAAIDEILVEDSFPVTEDFRFKDSDLLDSLGLIEVMTVLEDDYPIDFELSDLEPIQTVGDAIDVVIERSG